MDARGNNGKQDLKLLKRMKVHSTGSKKNSSRIESPS
jgi:hypothetical protein